MTSPVIDGEALERAVSLLRSAQRVFVMTGSGISAESGVPTFRAADGLWENYRLEDVATPQAVARNPEGVWEFYEMRRSNMHSVRPNPGHEALAAMESRFDSFTLATQNIDGLHQRAGSSAVLEVHGSLWRAHCAADCGHVADPFPFPAVELPPPCACGKAMLRPSVVLFGEMLPSDVFGAAAEGAATADVAFSIGTSSAVWPAAGLPLVTKQNGGALIEVNPDETEISGQCDVSLRGPAGVMLPALLTALAEDRA